MEQVECIYDRYIKDFKCKYYMTESTKYFIDIGDSIKVFGIKIDKLSKGGDVLSSACIDDIGINKNDVRQFIKVLSDGAVTPITLKDVINDNI